ncbi:MAG: hypothetical protein Kow0022_01700 [Phycisphaerales bacterium]
MNDPWLNLAIAHEEDLSAVPAGFGVVALVDGQRRCLLLAATGDMPRFCTRRKSFFLEAARDDGQARVWVLPCGSMFEAELEYLRAARRFMPQRVASITDRWRTWYLRLDPRAGRWSACSLEDLSEADASNIVIGPMDERSMPIRLGELLDDVFDLCRFPTELARRPGGRVCVYHEMGRCPAPCAGLEVWESFLARFAEASASARSMEALRQAVHHHMQHAASKMDFERAHELQRLAQWLCSRRAAGLSHIGDVRTWALVAVVPQPSRAVRLYVVRADGTSDLGSVAGRPEASLEPMLALIERATGGSVEPPYPRAGVEESWVACRRLFRKRRAEVYLTRAEALEPDTLLAAVRREAPAVDEETDSETRAGQP